MTLLRKKTEWILPKQVKGLKIYAYWTSFFICPMSYFQSPITWIFLYTENIHEEASQFSYYLCLQSAWLIHTHATWKLSLSWKFLGQQKYHFY